MSDPKASMNTRSITYDRPWTIGIVGHGVSSPTLKRARPDLCAVLSHPGCTYNPWSDQTWCLCGERIQDGNHVTAPHVSCCGGPLQEDLSAKATES